MTSNAITHSPLGGSMTEPLTVSYTVHAPIETIREYVRTNNSGYWASCVRDDNHENPLENAWLAYAIDEGDTAADDLDQAIKTALLNQTLREKLRETEATPDDRRYTEQIFNKIKKPLPPGYYVVDLDVARRAYIAGCKRWGEGWEHGQHGDSVGHDLTLQLALFGEVRYG